MAAVNPPFVIQDQSHPSDDFRRMVKALREAQGVINLGDMAVSQNGTPNMSVNVAAGLIVIDGTQDATHQGSYVCLNDAVTNLTISAADPTNPRIDIVVAKVQDTQYSGATDAWSLAVVTGTPAPSPTPPAAPANSIILAQVAVAALATSIVNANITDERTFNFNSQFPVGTTGAALAVPSAALGRFIGRWTTNFAPGTASFPYSQGDYGFDGQNMLWVCVSGGSPGTWKAASNAFRARAHATGGQAVPINTNTKVALANKDYDPFNSFDTTNSRYVAPVAGYYRVSLNCGFTTNPGWNLYLYKNGALYSLLHNCATSTIGHATGTDTIQLAASDYIEMFVFCNAAATVQNAANSLPFMAVQFEGSV